MGSDKQSARTRHGASDTAPEIERLMLEGYRQMSPAEKVRRVSDLNRAAVELAAEGIRLRQGRKVLELSDLAEEALVEAGLE